MATPNMNLTLPVVGVTAGPAYASQINAALTVVDGHDHTTGSGAQITPAALNINADLTIGSNNLTDAKTVRFTAQGAALPGSTPNLACLYVVGNNLYYNDGLGNQIAITSSGSIAGAAGNITGLVAPASVTFTGGGSPNYKFLSTATVSANLDAASILMRNPGVTATYALTLQAPTLASNYSITLPAAPAAPAFLQIDSSGIITAAPAIALGLTSSNLAADSVTTVKITDLNVTGAKIATSTIAPGKLSWSPILKTTVYNASTSFTVPTGITSILVSGVGAGGGGGGGTGVVSPAGGGGGGTSGHFVSGYPLPVTPGELVSIVIGTGGAGGARDAAGDAGAASYVTSATIGILFLRGGSGGAAGSGTSGGAGATSTIGGSTSSPGGAGGNSISAGSAGGDSIRVAGTAGMILSGNHGGGGGGGAGLDAATSAPGGNDGASAPANSGGGGQGGSGNQLGGNGGSAQISISYVPLV